MGPAGSRKSDQIHGLSERKKKLFGSRSTDVRSRGRAGGLIVSALSLTRGNRGRHPEKLGINLPKLWEHVHGEGKSEKVTSCESASRLSAPTLYRRPEINIAAPTT